MNFDEKGNLTESGWVQTIEVLKFKGAVGDNYTGASVGAFEVNPRGFLVAGNFENAKDADGGDVRNVFVASVNRETDAVTFNWLSEYGTGGEHATTPHMVRINDDRYLVLWSVSSGKTGDGVVCYRFIDGAGKPTSKTYSLAGNLSDCAPILVDGNVIWYTWHNSREVFYTIPVDAPAKSTVKVFCNGAKKDFYVYERPISNYADYFYISPTRFTYTGKVIKPKLHFSKLERGVDFTVSYANNVNAGTGAVVITGKGGYYGKLKLKFKIVNPLPKITVKGTSKKVSAAEAAAKAHSIKVKAKSSSGGKLSYEVADFNSGMSFKNGRVVLAKGDYEAGQWHSLTLIVKSAKTDKYSAGSKYVRCKFLIK